ncbi:MAG: hypothetical protein A2W91_00795 [Bacteroidetes bacterium GWF2_38_335]|nr:MAG: hypothetical protein A2W91_00795 [Bacteroidetes bacterium GWF2_38_335]OFY78370.1 MAG: hypothetical protein A2281_04175 [Bacteroidetes bacterium RIFOXYA12_FULL_38_20]HBS87433.1 HNH endonuclease [Bacteroidales bacterium]
MDTPLRLAIFEWLNQQISVYGNVLHFNVLNSGFKINGEIIHLLGSKGIWKPKQLDYPISVVSDPNGIYDDGFITDSLISYSYEGKNPNYWTNQLLRDCMMKNIPLIYLHKITKGKYYVHLPVYIVGDKPERLKFTIAAEQGIKTQEAGIIIQDPEEKYLIRRYSTREVKQRLHQSTFRELVLDAYREHCAICNLKHRELLDAAHIIGDGEELGHPVIQNGLSLCKIHHAAFDNHIIGISPDYVVHVREDILHEIDGPMLKYGIQSMDKNKLILPKSHKHYPDKERLDKRFEGFMKAG